MRIIRLISALCLAHELLASPIAKHPINPHYFVYQGKPLVLITTDQHYGAVINLDFDYWTISRFFCALPFPFSFSAKGFSTRNKRHTPCRRSLFADTLCFRRRD